MQDLRRSSWRQRILDHRVIYTDDHNWLIKCLFSAFGFGFIYILQRRRKAHTWIDKKSLTSFKWEWQHFTSLRSDIPKYYSWYRRIDVIYLFLALLSIRFVFNLLLIWSSEPARSPPPWRSVGFHVPSLFLADIRCLKP